MQFIWDPIYALNLVLCIAILALGYWGFNKSKDRLALFIGVAFGLFGLSHLATLLGLKEALTAVLLAVRTIAYFTVVYALYEHWNE